MRSLRLLAWWRRRRRRRRRIYGTYSDVVRFNSLARDWGPVTAIWATLRLHGRCRNHAAAEGIDFSVDYPEGSDQ